MKACSVLASVVAFYVVLVRVTDDSETIVERGQTTVNDRQENASLESAWNDRGASRESAAINTSMLQQVNVIGRHEVEKKRKNRLRRAVYRVNKNVVKNGGQRKADSQPKSAIVSRNDNKKRKGIQSDKDEDASFWGRVLQQSGNNQLTVVPPPNEGTSNAPPASQANSGRFDFFDRGDSSGGLAFDMYTILSTPHTKSGVLDRYGEWIEFRNSDVSGTERFQKSAIYRFQKDNQGGTRSVLQESRRAEASIPDSDVESMMDRIGGNDRKGSVMTKLKKQLGSRSNNRNNRNIVQSGKAQQQQPVASDAPKKKLLKKQSELGRALDFFIAGFPKCGTTTLLYAFSKHNETSMSDTEQCDLNNPSVQDTAAYAKLNTALSTLAPASRYGLKCPTALRTAQGIQRLKQHSPQARLVVGVRHPVYFFQSFYNYRVTEIYDRGSNEPIPPAESLVGPKPWKGVSVEKARFELFLMQLGKTKMSASQRQELERHPHMKLKQTPFKIFLYSLEQLEDSNTKRAADFRSNMQDFLQLEQPLKPFGKENKNHFVGDSAHPETIDICEERFDEVRRLLVAQGLQTREWFRNEFVHTSDVIVGGKAYFLELLDSWGTDPCQNQVEAQVT